MCCIPPPQFPRQNTIQDYDLEDLWFGRVLCTYKFKVQTDSDKAANSNRDPSSPHLRYTEHEVVLLATWFVFQPRTQEARDRTNIMLYEPSPRPVMYVVPAKDLLAKVPVVPAGDTGTIPARAPTGLGSGRFEGVGQPDSLNSPGSGSRLYYVNRWAMDWATDDRMGEGAGDGGASDDSDSEDEEDVDMNDAV